MTNNDLKQIRGVVKEEINSALNPRDEGLIGLEKKTVGIEKKLDILWEQVTEVTVTLEQIKDSIEEVKKILVFRSDKYDDNIEKLDKRTRIVEAHTGISPPPELTIIR
ncbi:hypothetical protein A3J13_01805 [Candidatus Daviesbacteria bacterium RIFCSPLOWO2_02_FULL_36_8]|uniref:Uncharacterized protein n=1 Tax=Candidatus Daviesbacteria bacterium RIFCSPLOWO2_02_FULL_36_8 TaxID=1797793 RepID=A0A1F5MHA7_9BACT|nr:MAG: hypothetical protein A3J13_01805 [Candidatus Daviesbacteria bacterium RIFCSPLOWO2_02_FULL_36_8]